MISDNIFLTCSTDFWPLCFKKCFDIGVCPKRGSGLVRASLSKSFLKSEIFSFENIQEKKYLKNMKAVICKRERKIV